MNNKVFVGVTVVVVAVLAIIFIVFNASKPSSHAGQKSQNSQSALASLNSGSAPWPVEYSQLSNRLRAINMPLLDAEAFAQHIHAHLDILVDKTPVTVPADIGIPPDGGITPVHTHDTSGIIHIESPDANATYTLKQFFDLWGVKFNDEQIGKYKNNSTDTISVYDNGTPVSDPANLRLAAHHEIVIAYGTGNEKTTIPTSYNFPSGL